MEHMPFSSVHRAECRNACTGVLRIQTFPHFPDWALTIQCMRSCADRPAPRIGTRHKKRKGAEALEGPERQAQGLADLADMASIFTGISLPLLGPQVMRYMASCCGAIYHACELAKLHISVACSITSLCCLNSVHVCRARQQAG